MLDAVYQVSPGRFGPNVDTRLFWEDIPFGLCILKNLAGERDPDLNLEKTTFCCRKLRGRASASQATV